MERDLMPLPLWMCEGASSLWTADPAACATCGYILSSNTGLGGLGLGTAMAGAAAGGPRDWRIPGERTRTKNQEGMRIPEPLHLST